MFRLVLSVVAVLDSFRISSIPVVFKRYPINQITSNQYPVAVLSRRRIGDLKYIPQSQGTTYSDGNQPSRPTIALINFPTVAKSVRSTVRIHLT